MRIPRYTSKVDGRTCLSVQHKRPPLARLPRPRDNEILHHAQTYFRSQQCVSITDYLAVLDDENKFVAVRIFGGGDRVKRGPQTRSGFGVLCSNEADHLG